MPGKQPKPETNRQQTPHEALAGAIELCSSTHASERAEALAKLAAFVRSEDADAQSAVQPSLSLVVRTATHTVKAFHPNDTAFDSPELRELQAATDCLAACAAVPNGVIAANEHATTHTLLAFIGAAALQRRSQLTGGNRAASLAQSERECDAPAPQQPSPGSIHAALCACTALAELVDSADGRLEIVEAGGLERLHWTATCAVLDAYPQLQAEAASVLSSCAELPFAREIMRGEAMTAALLSRLDQSIGEHEQHLGARAAEAKMEAGEQPALSDHAVQLLSRLLLFLAVLMYDSAIKTLALQSGALKLILRVLQLPLLDSVSSPSRSEKSMQHTKGSKKSVAPQGTQDNEEGLRLRAGVLAHAAVAFAVGQHADEWRAEVCASDGLRKLFSLLDVAARHQRADGRPLPLVVPLLTNVCLGIAYAAIEPQLNAQVEEVIPTFLQLLLLATPSRAGADAAAEAEQDLVASAALALAHASRERGCARACLEYGGVDPLLQLLCSHEEGLRVQAASAIRGCCAIPEWREQLLTCQGPCKEAGYGAKALVACGQYIEARPETSSACVHALDVMAMCACSRAGRIALYDAGALPRLAALLRQGAASDPIRLEGCSVYRSACVAAGALARDRSIALELIEEGVVRSLREMIARPERGTRWAAEACIEVLSDSCLSLKYWHARCLLVDEHIHDGFVDVGTRRPFASTGQLRSLPPSQQAECVFVAEDASGWMGSLLQRLAQLHLAPSSSTLEPAPHARVERLVGPAGAEHDGCEDSAAQIATDKENVGFLAGLVADMLGGAVKYEEYICFDDRVQECIRDSKLKQASDLVPLSALDLGGARHRSLLFKALADRIGLRCELHAGRATRGAHQQHSWVVAILPPEREGTANRFIVDLLHDVGKCYAEGTEHALRYQRLEQYAHFAARCSSAQEYSN